MSPDEGSCSRLSNKSEKNMADFDGEDLLSDDELSQINAHAHFGHLSSMASMYHTHMPHGRAGFIKSYFYSAVPQSL